jgi:hypothetical protein
MFGPNGATTSRRGSGAPPGSLPSEETNESETEIVPAAEGLRGHLGRCRLGRSAAAREESDDTPPRCRVEADAIAPAGRLALSPWTSRERLGRLSTHARSRRRFRKRAARSASRPELVHSGRPRRRGGDDRIDAIASVMIDRAGGEQLPLHAMCGTTGFDRVRADVDPSRPGVDSHCRSRGGTISN